MDEWIKTTEFALLQEPLVSNRLLYPQLRFLSPPCQAQGGREKWGIKLSYDMFLSNMQMGDNFAPSAHIEHVSEYTHTHTALFLAEMDVHISSEH